jgi:hypothetical protein
MLNKKFTSETLGKETMKTTIFLSFLICTGVFCINPIHHYQEPQKHISTDSTHTLSATQTSSSQVEKTIPIAPRSLSLNEWIGQEFVTLEKQNLFKKFGYEMRLADTSKFIDTVFETGNKRYLKCDRLCNRIFKVLSITPFGNESIVTMKDSSGLRIVATTHKSAVKEIALKNDLESARQRWIGKIVYSKKGTISTLRESGFGSLKVKIQDSLYVYDVRWGTIPLPVNPIWLMVKTSQGEKGFVAVRYSWTNTMTDLIQSNTAWNDEILEENPQLTYKWTPDMWNTINSHQITIGMNPDQVLLSWGKPLSKNQIVKDGIFQQHWKYPSQKLIFDKDSLISIENVSSN